MMNATEVIVRGAINPDGTLKLDEPVRLPPGPVEVSIRVSQTTPESTWVVLERIWDESKALGLTARSVQEIDSEAEALRNDSEAEMREIEEMQKDKS